MKTKNILLLLALLFCSMTTFAQDIAGQSWKYYDEAGDMPEGIDMILKFSTSSSMQMIWQVVGQLDAGDETIEVQAVASIPGTYTDRNNYLTVTLNNAKVSYKFTSSIDGRQVPASYTKLVNQFKSDVKALVRELQKGMGSKMQGKHWIDGGALQWRNRKGGVDTFYPNY